MNPSNKNPKKKVLVIVNWNRTSNIKKKFWESGKERVRVKNLTGTRSVGGWEILVGIRVDADEAEVVVAILAKVSGEIRVDG